MIDIAELKRLHEAATLGPLVFAEVPEHSEDAWGAVRAIMPDGSSLAVAEFDRLDDAREYVALRNALADIIAALTPAGGMETSEASRDLIRLWNDNRRRNSDEAYDVLVDKLLRDFSRLQTEVARLSTPPADVAGLIEQLDNRSRAAIDRDAHGEITGISDGLCIDAATALLSLSAKVKEVEKERDEARKDRDAWFATHTAHRVANDAHGKANDELFKRVHEATRRAEAAEAVLAELREKAKEVARFYGDKTRYTTDGICRRDHGPYLSLILDFGEFARTFLASLEKETG